MPGMGMTKKKYNNCQGLKNIVANTTAEVAPEAPKAL